MKKPTKMKVRNFAIKKENKDNEIIQKGFSKYIVKLVSFNVSLKQDYKAIEKHYGQKKHENG
mgnify:CR=1 FL=1